VSGANVRWRRWGSELIALGVPIVLVLGGCAGGRAEQAPTLSGTATAAAAPSAVSSPQEWLSAGGRDRASAVQRAFAETIGKDYRYLDRAKCVRLADVVAEATQWTETHSVSDFGLRSAWQGALTNIGMGAAACIDAVDHWSTRSQLDNAKARLIAADFNLQGAKAMRTFWQLADAFATR
jgi:hypothetical protein